MTNLIVILILLFGVSYWLIWYVRRDLREKIEQPKYDFQKNVQDFDQLCRKSTLNESEDNE